MVGIEADIALESWLFGFRPCSGQGQFTPPGNQNVKDIIILTLSQFISITYVYVRYAFLPCFFFKENKKQNLSSHSLREQNLLMSFCTKKRTRQYKAGWNRAAPNRAD